MVSKKFSTKNSTESDQLSSMNIHEAGQFGHESLTYVWVKQGKIFFLEGRGTKTKMCIAMPISWWKKQKPTLSWCIKAMISPSKKHTEKADFTAEPPHKG